MDQLHMDFLGKCYLCERPIEPNGFEVDHRLQRAWTSGSGLEHQWDNLFAACSDCNQRRPKKEPNAPPLDPGASGSMARLVQRWADDRPIFWPTGPKDNNAVSTTAELVHLHDPLQPKGRNLVSAIRSQLLLVFKTERDLFAAQAPEEQDDLRERLRRLLSRRAPFTAIVRSVVHTTTTSLFD